MSDDLILTPEALDAIVELERRRSSKIVATAPSLDTTTPHDDPAPPFGLEVLQMIASSHPVVLGDKDQLGKESKIRAASTYEIKFFTEADGYLSAVKLFDQRHFNDHYAMKELQNEVEVAKIIRETPGSYESPLSLTQIIVPSSLEFVGIKSPWRPSASLHSFRGRHNTNNIDLKYHMKAWFGVIAASVPESLPRCLSRRILLCTLLHYRHGRIQLDFSLSNACLEFGRARIDPASGRFVAVPVSNLAYPVKISDAGRISDLHDPDPYYVVSRDSFQCGHRLPKFLDAVFGFVCTTATLAAPTKGFPRQIPLNTFIQMWESGESLESFCALHADSAGLKSTVETMKSIPASFVAVVDVFGSLYRDVTKASATVFPSRWGLTQTNFNLRRMCLKLLQLKDNEEEYFLASDLMRLQEHFPMFNRRMEQDEWKLFQPLELLHNVKTVWEFNGPVDWKPVVQNVLLTWECSPCVPQPPRPNANLRNLVLFGNINSAPAGTAKLVNTVKRVISHTPAVSASIPSPFAYLPPPKRRKLRDVDQDQTNSERKQPSLSLELQMDVDSQVGNSKVGRASIPRRMVAFNHQWSREAVATSFHTIVLPSHTTIFHKVLNSEAIMRYINEFVATAGGSIDIALAQSIAEPIIMASCLMRIDTIKTIQPGDHDSNASTIYGDRLAKKLRDCGVRGIPKLFLNGLVKILNQMLFDESITKDLAAL